MVGLGAACGAAARGGEVFELRGDIGAGKTTFTKGLAKGLSVDDDVQSPTFTISRAYDGRDDMRLVHYDFYRLPDAGIMREELQDVLQDDRAIVVIEWSDVVSGVLPDDRLQLDIRPLPDAGRSVRITAGGEKSRRLLEVIR